MDQGIIVLPPKMRLGCSGSHAKYHKVGDFNNIHLFYHIFENQKFKIKLSAKLIFSEGSHFGLQMAVFTSSLLYVCEHPNLLFLRGYQSYWIRVSRMTTFYHNYFFKVLQVGTSTYELWMPTFQSLKHSILISLYSIVLNFTQVLCLKLGEITGSMSSNGQ